MTIFFSWVWSLLASAGYNITDSRSAYNTTSNQETSLFGDGRQTGKVRISCNYVPPMPCHGPAPVLVVANNMMLLFYCTVLYCTVLGKEENQSQSSILSSQSPNRHSCCFPPCSGIISAAGRKHLSAVFKFFVVASRLVHLMFRH
jgi:hypothetical protein